MGLFGQTKSKSPKEQVQEWRERLRKEYRQMDRQIHAIQREEEKVKRSLKDAAKKGDRDVCIILAKEVIHSRKAISRLHCSKAQINSVILSMQQQLATVRLAGSLQTSADVMRAMSSLIKVPEVAATMQEMSKEMMKAGIIEEMLEETLEVDEGEELEEEAQGEVDRILWEVTAGQLGAAPAAVSDSLPPHAVGATAAESDDEDDMTQMRARLDALRS